VGEAGKFTMNLSLWLSEDLTLAKVSVWRKFLTWRLFEGEDLAADAGRD
jgi:hypothetical protein